MPSRPWYQWYPADYLADTRLLSLEEHGAYRLLLDALWLNGPIADSDLNRARIMLVSTRKSRSIWVRLKPYFELNNGTFDHKRIAKQRAQAAEIIEKKRRAAESRWKSQTDAPACPHAHADASNARSARARPDPDPYKNRGSGLPVVNSPARAREEPALDPEQRAEAERIQAELAQRRAALGVVDGGPRHVAGWVTALRADPGNPDPGEDEK